MDEGSPAEKLKMLGLETTVDNRTSEMDEAANEMLTKTIELGIALGIIPAERDPDAEPTDFGPLQTMMQQLESMRSKGRDTKEPLLNLINKPEATGAEAQKTAQGLFDTIRLKVVDEVAVTFNTLDEAKENLRRLNGFDSETDGVKVNAWAKLMEEDLALYEQSGLGLNRVVEDSLTIYPSVI